MGSKKTVTAFAVSGQGIRAVTMQNARRPVIVSCRQIEVPAAEIFFVTEIGRLLNKAVDLSANNYIIAGLECEQLFLYDLQLPRISGRKMKQAVRLKAEEIWQDDIKEMIVDYMIMDGNADDDKQDLNVLLAMLDQQTSGQIAAAFRARRMELDRLDSLAAAAGCCVLFYQTELLQKNCFILDIQHQHFYLNYYRQGSLQEIKLFDRHQSDQIEAISECIRLKACEAETIVLTGNIGAYPDLPDELYESTGIVSAPISCRPEINERARSITDENGALLPVWAAAVGLAVNGLKGVSHESGNKFAFAVRQKKQNTAPENDADRNDLHYPLFADGRNN